MLFVDSSVILDVITADPQWASWSATQLAQALDAGPVLINAMAHADYRQRGCQRTMGLPDFLTGAHALLESTALITRDERRYRQAFPVLKLILP